MERGVSTHMNEWMKNKKGFEWMNIYEGMNEWMNVSLGVGFGLRFRV